MSSRAPISSHVSPHPWPLPGSSPYVLPSDARQAGLATEADSRVKIQSHRLSKAILSFLQFSKLKPITKRKLWPKRKEKCGEQDLMWLEGQI